MGMPRRGQQGAEVLHLADAEAQVVLVQHLAQAARHGLEVAAGEAAVGGEPLDHDQPLLQRLQQLLVAAGQEAADVGQAVLLGAHGAAVGVAEDLAHDLGDRAVGLPRLALLDEPGVLGEAAGVDVEGDAELAAELGDGLDVGQRDRLAAAGVVGQGEHAERDVLARAPANSLRSAVEVHVALEGVLGPAGRAPRG